MYTHANKTPPCTSHTFTHTHTQIYIICMHTQPGMFTHTHTVSS